MHACPLRDAVLVLAALIAALSVIPGARVLEIELVPTGRPQIAIWLEDQDQQFIDTIMVTRLVGTYGLGNRPGRGDFGTGYHWPYGRREMTLPVWAHRRGVEYDRLVFQDCHENAIRYHNPISSTDAFYCRPTKPAEHMIDALSCPTSRFDSCKGIPLRLIDRTASAECAALIDSLPLKSYYPPRNDLLSVRSGYDWEGVADFSTINDLDAVSTATPPPNQLFHAAYALPEAIAPGEYVVWIEVSQEEDFNNSHRYSFYPDPVEPTFGIDFMGQPSVVWRAPITISTEGVTLAFSSNYAGYGSYDGSDGELRPPDNTITTGVPGSGAERLLVLPGSQNNERVRVSFNPEGICAMPAAVADLRAAAIGYTSLGISFSAVDGAAYYDVRYAIGSGAITDEATFDAAIRAGSPRETELAIDQLAEGTSYTIAVRAHAACGLGSELAVIEAATSVRESEKIDECFIATAAYGSKEEAHVVELRRFRDQVLMKSEAGRALVDRYYELSPPIAGVVREQALLRAWVRSLLGPVLIAIKSAHLI